MAQSVKTDFGSGHDLAVHEFKARVRLGADNSEPGAASDSVSPSLSDFPPLTLCLCLSLSLSQEWVNIKKKLKNKP